MNFFGNLVDADMTLENLERFLTVVDEFLRKTARHLAGKYDRFGMDRSDAFAEDFTEVLYASVITAIVTFLERGSRIFTDALRDACSSPLGARDLSGTWLDRFRKYCESIALLPLGLTDAEWEDMKGVVEVRNCLVHSGGWLPDFQGCSAVEAFARRHKVVLSNADYLRADLRIAPSRAGENQGLHRADLQGSVGEVPKELKGWTRMPCRTSRSANRVLALLALRPLGVLVRQCRGGNRPRTVSAGPSMTPPSTAWAPP